MWVAATKSHSNLFLNEASEGQLPSLWIEERALDGRMKFELTGLITRCAVAAVSIHRDEWLDAEIVRRVVSGRFRSGIA